MIEQYTSAQWADAEQTRIRFLHNGKPALTPARSMHAREMVEQGVTIAPYSEPAPEIPGQVSMAQARIALEEAGKLAAVEAAIASLKNKQKKRAEVAWEYATTVTRNGSLVRLLSKHPAVNMTDAEIDALMVAASEVEL